MAGPGPDLMGRGEERPPGVGAEGPGTGPPADVAGLERLLLDPRVRETIAAIAREEAGAAEEPRDELDGRVLDKSLGDVAADDVSHLVADDEGEFVVGSAAKFDQGLGEEEESAGEGEGGGLRKRDGLGREDQALVADVKDKAGG